MANDPKPGARRGRGRPLGSKNRRKVSRDAAIESAGITPRDFLIAGLAFHYKQVRTEQRKGAKADAHKIADAFAAGREFAKDAAPYCHAKLASIEHSGREGGPPIKVESLTDAQLDILIERITAAGIAGTAGGEGP